jgi:hypothetical protein
MTVSNVIDKMPFRVDGTSDGRFSLNGIFVMWHHSEAQSEVRIRVASAARGGPPGVRDARVGNGLERGSPVP